MRNASLARGLGFAFVAGLGAVAWQLACGFLLGRERSLSLYLLALAVPAALALAPTLRAAAAGGLLASFLCGALALTDPALATALLGVLVIHGLVRSALYAPGPFARGLAFELVLGLGSTLLFALVYDHSLLGGAVAVWSFWLVQSAFAILPRGAPPLAASAQDPFEAAAAAAERVLDGRA